MFVPGCLIMVALVVVWRVDDNQLLQTSRRHDCSSLFPFGPEWRAADSCLALERGPLGSVAVPESIYAGRGVYAIHSFMHAVLAADACKTPMVGRWGSKIVCDNLTVYANKFSVDHQTWIRRPHVNLSTPSQL